MGYIYNLLTAKDNNDLRMERPRNQENELGTKCVQRDKDSDIPPSCGQIILLRLVVEYFYVQKDNSHDPSQILTTEEVSTIV